MCQKGWSHAQRKLGSQQSWLGEILKSQVKFLLKIYGYYVFSHLLLFLCISLGEKKIWLGETKTFLWVCLIDTFRYICWFGYIHTCTSLVGSFYEEKGGLLQPSLFRQMVIVSLLPLLSNLESNFWKVEFFLQPFKSQVFKVKFLFLLL